METDAAVNSTAPPKASGDIVFNCPKCVAPLVVDGAASGLMVNCEQCGNPIIVPHPHSPSETESPAPKTDERLADLRRHLKENESQRTEISGYINQHSIQLHRWQLRLQTLDERKKELMNEIVALS